MTLVTSVESKGDNDIEYSHSATFYIQHQVSKNECKRVKSLPTNGGLCRSSASKISTTKNKYLTQRSAANSSIRIKGKPTMNYIQRKLSTP